jgi:ABC-type phosphate transport system permease subunit
MKYGTALVLVAIVLLFNSASIALRVWLRRNRRW